MGVRKERNCIKKIFFTLLKNESFFENLNYLIFYDEINYKDFMKNYFMEELEKINFLNRKKEDMAFLMVKHYGFLLNKFISDNMKLIGKNKIRIDIRNRKEPLYIILKFMFFNNLINSDNFNKLLDLNLYLHDEVLLMIISSKKHKSSLYFMYLNYLICRSEYLKIYKLNKMIKEFLLKEYIMSPLNYSDFNSKIIENLGIKEKEIKTLSPESKWDVIFKTKREEKIKEFFNENPNQKNKNAVKSFVNFFMNNINLYRDLYIYNLEIIINNCFLTLKDMSQIIQNINMSYYEKIISEEKRKILLNEMTFIISKKEDAILKEKIRSSSDFVASKKRF